jgi:BTB/POZ domain
MKSGVMVKISVGPRKVSWVVHQEVICQRSEFFRMAFTGGFQESEKKEMHLEEEDPRMFGHFVDWLYGKQLYCSKDHANPSEVTFKHVQEWLALYVFADKISLQALRDEALERYTVCAEGTLPCTNEILLIYQNTVEQSSLRQHAVKALVVEFFDQGLEDFDFISDAIACHIEFTRDLTAAIKSHTRLPTKNCNLASCSAHNKTPRVILRVTRGQTGQVAGTSGKRSLRSGH